MAEHLSDPLDYLYEELPPERMDEARKHLTACPACRGDMRAVRETVKVYRQAPKPAAPAGLAARVAKTAVEEGRRVRTVSLPQPVSCEPSLAASALVSGSPGGFGGFGGPGGDVDIEGEFARLKEEVLKEIPKGWRTWLFHPAWTVAASVIFLCALLIHFSPRMQQLETRFLPVAAHRDESSSVQIRDRERLPASQPRVAATDAPGVRQAEPDPILQEAAAMNEIIELPPFDTASAAKAAPAQSLRPRPAQPLRTAATLLGAHDVRPEASASVDAAVAPSEPSERPVVDAATEEAAPDFPSPADPIPPETLKSLGEKTAEAAAAPVVIMNMPDAASVPQLVERPQAYDPAERVQSLTLLAGMLMSSGDFDDARKTIALLESYDPEAADRLRQSLESVEKAAGEKADAEQRAAESAAPVPVEPGPDPDTGQAIQRPDAAEPFVVEATVSVTDTAGAGDTGTAAAVPSSVPAYAKYMETMEPPEDPPMSTVRVPTAAMSYGHVDASSAPMPIAAPVPVPMPMPVAHPEAAPVFSPVVVPEMREAHSETQSFAVESAAPGDAYSAGVGFWEGDGAVGNAVPVEEGAPMDAYAPVVREEIPVPVPEPAEPERRSRRESVYVDTPIVGAARAEDDAGTGAAAGVVNSAPSVGHPVMTPPPHALPMVYAPIPVPVVVRAPVVGVYAEPAQAAPRRSGRRAFTTDPYFRDY